MFNLEAKNKKSIFIILFFIFLIIVIFVGFKIFIAADSEDSIADGKQRVFIDAKSNLKKLDSDTLNSPQFAELKEYKIKHSTVEELNIGNNSPFESD
ncbi:MAG: hypothetical protein U9R06_01285 [Patescibacteria group bacterium]|nr:hypothetical protein [Patescibacteria group bacterium]